MGKKGIRYENGLFWSDQLIDWLGRSVAIRVDVWDAGRIYCFEPQTRRFLCEARDLARSGMTVMDFIRAGKKADNRVRERAKALKRLAQEAGDLLADEIAMLRAKEKAHDLPLGELVHSNPFIRGALKTGFAVRGNEANERGLPVKQSAFKASERANSLPEDRKVVRLSVHQEEKGPEQRYFSSSLEKFDWLRVKNRGRHLTDHETAWLRECAEERLEYAEMFCEQWPESDQR